jgi:hypothetical protein
VGSAFGVKAAAEPGFVGLAASPASVRRIEAESAAAEECAPLPICGWDAAPPWLGWLDRFD